MHKPLASVTLASVAVLALAGCSASTGSTATDGEGGISVVASTNVYGDIASRIGGDHVDVTSIISSLSQDPHEYEASASDQLTVKKAKLIVENGGGYDSYMESLRDASGADAEVVTAVEYSHDYPGAEVHDHAEGEDGHEHESEPTESADTHDGEADGADTHEGHDHIEGFNEHVWYDPHTMEHVAEAIAEQLIDLDSANKVDYEKNLADFQSDLAGLEESLATIKSSHEGDKIFVTEPVPLHLAQSAGLENVTPEAFSEAVEEGQDVPPATLLDALDLLKAGDVKVLFANAQTGGAETTQVIDAAKAAGTPVQEVTEVVPEGKTYITWMQDNITTLAGNLDK
ncbi:zinc/manganese transport system substrate-binding protein [Microbacterium natoriense]|uniref:Zinc/manganese transport system substrate-binding protein n=1 Tax=Microbacterium natoriense TaxID=284570 RepID=A0AAW8ESJ3_9MICO|nr:zinc ABC transporter substrate-binding protein [Microbacterium natoriense]MDQ0646092.1 zinc/manganese transport system substrate-binding protein [Microbacterium natoriense]